MSFQALDQIEAFLAREARVFVLHPWAADLGAVLRCLIPSKTCRRAGCIPAFAVTASALAQLDRLSILASLLHPVGWTPGILAAGAVAYWRLLLRLALPPCLVVPTSTSSGPSHPTYVTLTPLPLSSRHVGGVTLGI